MERLSCLSVIRISVFNHECCVLGIDYLLLITEEQNLYLYLLKTIENNTTGPERI